MLTLVVSIFVSGRRVKNHLKQADFSLVVTEEPLQLPEQLTAPGFPNDR